MSNDRRTADFLRSLGFEFSISSRQVPRPEGYTPAKLISRHHRIECRRSVGGERYGLIFEGIVAWVLRWRFRYDILRGVRIHDEGSGGDYDILAFSPPHLLYLECKTGKEIEFEPILARHEFLRPALTLILIDRPKREVQAVVSQVVQPVLTAQAVRKDPKLAGRGLSYPVALISDASLSFAVYHTKRNLFIASGEDLERAIQQTLRYFHQVVQQRSYWS